MLVLVYMSQVTLTFSTEQKIIDKMTDHKVSDFMFKKSNHVVAPASKYPGKATSDTMSVNPLPLLQQYICVGYDSRELVDMLKYELCVYPTTQFEAVGTMLQSGKPAWANPLNSMESRTDTFVIMWKLCKYVKTRMVKTNCVWLWSFYQRWLSSEMEGILWV